MALGTRLRGTRLVWDCVLDSLADCKMADLPACKYGKKCYRKNADHLKKFTHNDDENSQDNGNTTIEPPPKKRRKNEDEVGTTSDGGNKAALKDLKLELVGPYDILSGKQFQTAESSSGSLCLHYRYFCDPPEFVTVLKGDDTVGLHIGYYRDDPDDKPVLVASNEAKTTYEFKVLGDNIFAGISNSLKNTTKQKGATESRKLKEKIERKAKEKNIHLESNPPSIKARNKKVVTKTFHKMGIVVPLDENGVGYRDLQMSNAELKRMLTDIVDNSQREVLLDELQDIITRIQFANDECDYGMGLELGLDLFSFGHEIFNRKTAMLLTLAYQLLNKNAFGKVVERHLEQRDKNTLYINFTES